MYERELQCCLDVLKEANRIALEIYNSRYFKIEIKEDDSPVTIADKTIDKLLRETLSKEFPGYGMLTEESIDDKSRLDKDYVWIIDPIDGTKDFIGKTDEFSINIGLSYKHQPVFGIISVPAINFIYYGIKGEGAYKIDDKGRVTKIHVNDKLDKLICLTSRYHFKQEEKDLIEKYKDKIDEYNAVGSTVKGCRIAEGKAELHYRISEGTKEWDTCAMQAVVEAAGGYILKLDGTPITYNREDVYNHGGYVICNRLENFLL